METCPLLKLYQKKPDPRALNMLLIASSETENLIETDRILYFESKLLVEELVNKFGKEYYNDKDYILYMKNSNKTKI